MKFSRTLLLSLLGMVLVPAFLTNQSFADELSDELPEQAEEQAEPSPLDVENIQSVYLVPNEVKGTERDAERIRSGQLEAVEWRFHVHNTLTAKRKRLNLFFEAIHHVPGKKPVALAEVAYTKKMAQFTKQCESAKKNLAKVEKRYSTYARKGDYVKKKISEAEKALKVCYKQPVAIRPYQLKDENGNEVTRYGMSFRDYQFSSGQLQDQFDQLWGDLIYVRDGGAHLAGAASLFITYQAAKCLTHNMGSKRLQSICSKIPGLPIATGIAAKLLKTAAHDLKGQGVERVKGLRNVVTHGWFDIIVFGGLAVGEYYFVHKWAKNLANDKIFGEEERELDWLQRMLPRAKNNAMNGVPIDTTDTNLNTKGIMEAIDQARADGAEIPAPEMEEPIDPEQLPIVTIPIAGEMNFAVKSTKRLFDVYAADYVEDRVPGKKAK